MGAEANFKLRIHKRMPPVTVFHRQSMAGAVTFGGTVDMYYDGDKRDLWVEYKALERMPQSGIAVGDYTTLQLNWMLRRWERGGNCWGIVALPNGLCCVQQTPYQFKGTPVKKAIDVNAAATLIMGYCND
jgi:hypothetical protein